MNCYLANPALRLARTLPKETERNVSFSTSTWREVTINHVQQQPRTAASTHYSYSFARPLLQHTSRPRPRPRPRPHPTHPPPHDLRAHSGHTMDAHQQQQELTIKTLAGATFVLPIIDFEVVTVGEIKVMLADRQGGFPVLAQRLIYCGAELADDARTLGHYGVMHETCLHLVERAAAGGGGAGASSSEHPVDAAPRAQREAELARLANAYGTLYADIERCVDARAEQTVDEVRAESRAIAAAAASGGACPEADRLENNAATLRASHSATVNSPSLMAGSPEADQLDKQAAGARQKAGAARAQGRAAVQTGDIEDAQARRAEADAAEATANVLEDQALQVRASALQQMRSAMARVAAAADELGEEARRARVAAAAIADGLADRRAALHLPVTLEGSCGAEVIRLLEERDASLAEGNVERARHLYANAKAYTALKAKLAGLAASQWLAQEAELQAFRDHRNALATQRDEVLHADVAALREEIRLLNSKGTAMRTDIHRLYADAEARADAEAKAQAEAEAKVAALREKIRRLTSEGTAMRTEIHRLCAEAEARTEAEAKARAEAEAKARAEAEAKARAEAEAKARAEAEAKAREEAKARAEAEAKARAAEQAAAAAATCTYPFVGAQARQQVLDMRPATFFTRLTLSLSAH